MTDTAPPPGQEPTPAEKVIGAIGGMQALAIGVTRQATEFAADRIPPLPGFPRDVLAGPMAISDRVFASVDDTVGARSPLARDVIRQQGTFVRNAFGTVQPIVDALSGRRGDVGG